MKRAERVEAVSTIVEDSDGSGERCGWLAAVLLRLCKDDAHGHSQSRDSGGAPLRQRVRGGLF